MSRPSSGLTASPSTGAGPGSHVAGIGQPADVPTDRTDTASTNDPAMARPVVALAGVTVDYGDGPVLVDFDLEVATGEWVGLLGPNGAGKSTALGVVSGLVTHDGRLRINGADPGPWKPRTWASQVALVPQRPIIPPGLTVTDYVLLGRTAHIPTFGVESATDLDGVADALDRLDLHDFADRPILALSGGELQRVVLARALVQEASILLLDEPTSSLDIGHGQHVLELIDMLRAERGLTVLSAMHDLTLASQFADRVVLLDHGRSVADGAPADVLTRERLADHYDADVQVLDDGTGGVIVVPIRSRRRARTRPTPTTDHGEADGRPTDPSDPSRSRP